MKKIYAAIAIVGALGFALVWYEIGWVASVGLLLALWANNAMIELGYRIRQKQEARTAAEIRKTARNWIRDQAEQVNAGSAAPGGAARVSAQNGEHTNIEAEVTGRESP